MPIEVIQCGGLEQIDLEVGFERYNGLLPGLGGRATHAAAAGLPEAVLNGNLLDLDAKKLLDGPADVGLGGLLRDLEGIGVVPSGAVHPLLREERPDALRPPAPCAVQPSA